MAILAAHVAGTTDDSTSGGSAADVALDDVSGDRSRPDFSADYADTVDTEDLAATDVSLDSEGSDAVMDPDVTVDDEMTPSCAPAPDGGNGFSASILLSAPESQAVVPDIAARGDGVLVAWHLATDAGVRVRYVLLYS